MMWNFLSGWVQRSLLNKSLARLWLGWEKLHFEPKGNFHSLLYNFFHNNHHSTNNFAFLSHTGIAAKGVFSSYVIFSISILLTVSYKQLATSNPISPSLLFSLIMTPVWGNFVYFKYYKWQIKSTRI